MDFECGTSKPTYDADHYVDVLGRRTAQKLCNLMLDVFFVVEPMPDNVWRFYVKEEAFEELKKKAPIAWRFATISNTP
jgi:hypothetical protein